jgi:hypothetical protein
MKAEGGYAVLPGSLHPSGRRYKVISGDFANIPTISQAQADALVAAARKLDEAPQTRQQIAAREAAKESRKYRNESNGQGSVIDTFNKHTSIDSVLERFGYTPQGDRYVRPGGKSASVVVQEGRSFHHSSNDPLADGYWHRPFDLLCHYEHGSDCGAAVRAAAQLLGLTAYTTPSKPAQHRTSVGVGARWQPFPVDVLPEPVRSYVNAASKSLGVDPACDPAATGGGNREFSCHRTQTWLV